MPKSRSQVQPANASSEYNLSCAVREQQPRPQVHLLMSSLPRRWRLLRSSLCALGTQQTLSPHSIHVTLESSTEFISLLNNVLSVGADLHGWCLKNGQIRSKIVDATATVVTHVTDRRLGPMTRLIPLIDGYLPSDSIAIVVDEDNAYKRQFICRLVTELMKEESAGHQNAVLGTRSVVVPRSACTLTKSARVPPAKTGATPNGSAVRAPILEQTGGLVSRVHVWKPALLSRLANVTPCWSTVPELRKNDDLWVSGVLHEHGVHRMRISSGWLFKTVHYISFGVWGLHNIKGRNLTLGIVALQAVAGNRGAQRIDFRASAGCGSKGS